ncbi:MAG: hypothetical protein O7A98_05315 [Acidobacteria bacterium]|nr:hypothetical protein [Acidobacteriota bacterium]
MRKAAGWALLVAAMSAALGQAQDQPLGRSAAFSNLDAGPSVTVGAGTSLRSRPDPTAEVLAIVDEEVDLAVLERRGVWVRTHYRDWAGWLAPGGEPASRGGGLAGLETGALQFDTSIAERAAKVASARALMANENSGVSRLGPWPVHTDVHDRGLLERLDKVASGLLESYADRFGLAPALGEPGVIVLFASEDDYRRFTDENTNLGGLHGDGHADSGMAALFVSDESTDQTASVLIHELIHLINGELFARVPSTWLEEGLANDLGLARIDKHGNVEAGTLGGNTRVLSTTSRSRVVNRIQTGGRVVWLKLIRDWSQKRSRLRPLAELLDLDWRQFVDPAERSSNYAQSTFLIRMLLDDGDEDTAAAFRDFLRSAADGAPSNAATLAAALGTTPADLERRWERWLTQNAVLARQSWP